MLPNLVSQIEDLFGHSQSNTSNLWYIWLSSDDFLPAMVFWALEYPFLPRHQLQYRQLPHTHSMKTLFITTFVQQCKCNCFAMCEPPLGIWLFSFKMCSPLKSCLPIFQLMSNIMNMIKFKVMDTFFIDEWQERDQNLLPKFLIR